MSQTYADAGVDIDAGERIVGFIRKSAKTTYTKSVLGSIGGFGALYDAGFKGYKSPVLVTSVDGVGTKLMVAQSLGIHDTVGQDLVNHCVNDIVVCGARPLYFLDYFATGKLRPEVGEAVISGFVKACRENQCSLIGGETAEMPGFYEENKYDLSGTIVGVVEKKKILGGDRVKSGDILIGLRSTGLHTNGYSLARSVLLKKYGLGDYIDELGTTLGEALLAVHRSYLKTVTAVVKRFNVHGLSHITGGGIFGNTMRVVPRGLQLSIDWTAWQRPAIFQLIQRIGGVPEQDMRRTFNLGVGMLMLVSRKRAGEILKFLLKRGEAGFMMGEVVREGAVRSH